MTTEERKKRLADLRGGQATSTTPTPSGAVNRAERLAQLRANTSPQTTTTPEKSLLQKTGDTSKKALTGLSSLYSGTAKSVGTPLLMGIDTVRLNSQTKRQNEVSDVEGEQIKQAHDLILKGDKVGAKRVLQSLQQAQTNQAPSVRTTEASNYTPKQVAGNLASMALEVGPGAKGLGFKLPDAVTKVGSVIGSNKAVQTGANLIQKAKTVAPKTMGAIEGGLQGQKWASAFQGSQALQENKSLPDVVKASLKPNPIAIGLGAPLGALAGKFSPEGVAVTQKSREKLGAGAKSKFVTNLNKIFDQSPKSVKKINDYAKERDIDLSQEIADRNFKPVVENERLKFGTESFDILDKEIVDNSNLIDELIKQYPDTQVPIADARAMVAKQIASNPVLFAEGRVGDLTREANSIIDEFAAQTGRDSFTLAEIQNFKKGAWGASKKFKVSALGKSDAYSEIGTAFKNIIEQEVPDAAVREINQKIGRSQEVYKLLDSINSLQDGGIVLKGGKIGKYVGNLTGTVIGGGIGSLVGGPVGAGIGALVGGKTSSILRNLSQKSSVLGALDRQLIKYAKKVPDSAEITAAKKFIELVKKGEKPTVTPRVQSAFDKMWKDATKSQQKLLGEATKGAPQSQNFVPIPLYGETQYEKGVKVLQKKSGQYSSKPTVIEGKVIKKSPKSIAPESKGAKILLNKTKGTETSLMNEAKKYKSAEEFVKAQGTPVYRGGVDLSNEKVTDAGISFSKGKNIAEDFAKEKGGKVSEYVISPQAKIVEYENIPNISMRNVDKFYDIVGASEGIYPKNALIEHANVLENDFVKSVKWAKENGYDVVKLPIEDEFRIINPSVIKTKSQLEQLWKEANKK